MILITVKVFRRSDFPVEHTNFVYSSITTWGIAHALKYRADKISHHHMPSPRFLSS